MRFDEYGYEINYQLDICFIVVKYTWFSQISKKKNKNQT